MKNLALIILRDGTNFGCCGPMFLEEALDMRDDLDKYDFWKIIDFGQLLHSHSAKLVIDDKYEISKMEREARKSRKEVNINS